jgi:hypothetical protein
MKAIWSKLKRPYTVIDEWLMAHHPALWAERYHLGFFLSLILTLLATVSGMLLWRQTSPELDLGGLFSFLAVCLLLYWIWQRVRLHGCIPVLAATRGWWFGLLDIAVCFCIAFAPISYWKGVGIR